MSNQLPPHYVLDDDTLELLETVMNWAQRHIDQQESDEHFEDMSHTLAELGDRFNVERSNIEYTETPGEDGRSTTIQIRIIQDGETRPLTPEERRKMLKVVADRSDELDAEVITHPATDDEDEPTKH